jgi:hypothetical protein
VEGVAGLKKIVEGDEKFSVSEVVVATDISRGLCVMEI